VPSPRDLKHQLKLFGANLRRLRVEKKLTQERLSELADLNIRTLQKMEAGESNVVVTTAARLRAALDCTWDQLMSRLPGRS